MTAACGALGAEGDGGIRGDAVAVRFLNLVAWNEASGTRHVQECGAANRRLGLRLQASRFAHDFGNGFMGWNVGHLCHGSLHLREGWVAGPELPGGISVPTPWMVCLRREQPKKRVSYVVGQWQQDLPPQST